MNLMEMLKGNVAVTAGNSEVAVMLPKGFFPLVKALVQRALGLGDVLPTEDLDTVKVVRGDDVVGVEDAAKGVTNLAVLAANRIVAAEGRLSLRQGVPINGKPHNPSGTYMPIGDPLWFVMHDKVAAPAAAFEGLEFLTDLVGKDIASELAKPTGYWNLGTVQSRDTKMDVTMDAGPYILRFNPSSVGAAVAGVELDKLYDDDAALAAALKACKASQGSKARNPRPSQPGRSWYRSNFR